MDTGTIARAIENLTGERCLQPQVTWQPLRGGLTAHGVRDLKVRYSDGRGRRRVASLVAKEVKGHCMRERWIYQLLHGWRAARVAPRLLAVEEREEGAVLYLEAVRRARAWPWQEPGASQQVLERLADLHLGTTDGAGLPDHADWDYEAELAASAPRTVEALEHTASVQDIPALSRALPATRRVAEALPAMREELLRYRPLPAAVIHGDVHTGNVLLRRRGGREEPILIDWGRARVASPLEDVSSWLQSLGTWEPEVRRRHDTLLRSYLDRRGLDPKLGRELRDAYWLAGASNALAGALTYHLWQAREAPSHAQRSVALGAALDWLRVVRRADASWS